MHLYGAKVKHVCFYYIRFLCGAEKLIVYIIYYMRRERRKNKLSVRYDKTFTAIVCDMTTTTHRFCFYLNIFSRIIAFFESSERGCDETAPLKGYENTLRIYYCRIVLNFTTLWLRHKPRCSQCHRCQFSQALL